MGQNHLSNQLPLIAIVSVTRNRCELLMRLYSQLGSLNYPKELIDIYLVDSASTDDTVKNVQRYFPKVNLITSGEILGIAAGFNTAIQAALNAEQDYRYIWLLDDDAEIDSQTLIPLVETAEKDPNIAVVGSAVYEPVQRSKLITAGLNLDWKKSNISFHVPRTDSAEDVFDVALIPACSSLTRAELYKKFGLWDRRFWLYWGDTEWCTRMLRKGCRICCDTRSRVWHRNWSNIKPDFYFPSILHDRIRSALLFNLLYNPQHSIQGVRYLIAKSYLKAAFENLTTRPNFSRAYHEGVQDFLRGDFSKKDFSSWYDGLEMGSLEEICRSLSAKISKKPRIILNQIDDEAQKEKIKEVFQNYFDRVEWEEIPVKSIDASDRFREYLSFHIPQLMIRLLTFYKKRDVIISPVEVSYLYNIAAARYTLLLNASSLCCLRENRILKGFADLFRTIIKGLKVVYIEFPNALKSHSTLKESNAVYSSLENNE